MTACDIGASGYSPAMPSSVVRLVALDHDRILRLARRACSPGPSQERWRHELVRLVRAHAAAEAAVLDPTGPGADRLRQVDDDVATVTGVLATAPLDGDEMAVACERLGQLLRVHADLMTEHVLGPLEEVAPRREIRRLGGAYETRRDEALRASGTDEPPPRRLDLPRAELYELARRAGIQGRSAMSRRDLISELQRRQAR